MTTTYPVDPSPELLTEPATQSSDEPSEAIALAEIEAETRIELAEIHAEVETAAIEARQEGQETWMTETAHLREQVAALGEAVSATATVVEALLSNQSNPSPSPEPEAVEVMDPEAMMTPETSNSTQTEASEKSPDASPDKVPELVAPKRRARMI